MTWEELALQVATAEKNGLDRIVLVVTRRTPPGRYKNEIRVKGLGIGEVCNCIQMPLGMHQIVAWFRIGPIKKTLALALPPAPPAPILKDDGTPQDRD